MSPDRTTTSHYKAAVKRLEDIEPGSDLSAEFVRNIGAVLDEVPNLSPYRWELVLAMESVLGAVSAAGAMAGGPATVAAEVARENLVREAARRRVFDEPMMEADSVARALGSRSVNLSQYANLRRRRGEILGLPVANHYMFPAFQIDADRRRVLPVVAEVNRLLGAAKDPWGVASWWFSDNARLGGARPADLAVDDSRAAEVLRVAHAVLAPVG
ncbi:MAG: hypothetical protein Q8K99_14730 [Actinomycetota bacterium]|nr:hypothetical protein [Actinomycetota bacterium]